MGKLCCLMPSAVIYTLVKSVEECFLPFLPKWQCCISWLCWHREVLSNIVLDPLCLKLSSICFVIAVLRTRTSHLLCPWCDIQACGRSMSIVRLCSSMELTPNPVCCLAKLCKIVCYILKKYKIMLQNAVLSSEVPCPEAELVLLLVDSGCEVPYWLWQHIIMHHQCWI